MVTPSSLRSPRAAASPETSRGFTLIELLVVVAILGIVAAIASVNLLNALHRARQRATMSDMRSISKAIEVYAIDKGFVPSSAGTLEDQIAALTPYQISVLPVRDHWSHLYRFSSNGVDDYTLVSYGKDGAAGAEITLATRNDFNRDIVLHNGVFTAAPE